MITTTIPNFSPSMTVRGMVEFFNDSTIVSVCTCSDHLQSFTVDRVGENNKFFGYGICQKANINIIDIEREKNFEKGYQAIITMGDGNDIDYPYPNFYLEEIERNEDTNLLSIVAYDALYKASSHTLAEVELATPYTIRDVAKACCDFLGLNSLQIVGLGEDETCFDTEYAGGANFDGTETIREVLDAIAEVTQTIYYATGSLRFQRLDISGDPVFTITKDKYFNLKTYGNVALEAICHTTELGDNVTSGVIGGVTQYVRDNPFWELRDDVATLLDNAVAATNGLSINQFMCENWEGDYRLELGDKIGLVIEDGSTIATYLLNDSVMFDGTLAETTQWTYESNDNETESNPTSLGDAIKQTYARVDKVNQQIELKVSSATKDAIEGNKVAIDEELKILKANQTTITQTATDITLRVESIETNGTTKVQGTGYKFDEEGFTVSKDGAPTSTLITEDGMTINNNSGTTMLTANSDGVAAHNLRSNYIWIGEHSRFEDYEGNRTGCFWIGE